MLAHNDKLVSIYEIDGVSIGVCPIKEANSTDARLTRRQREQAAVSQILSGVSLMHDANGAPMLEGWHVSVTHSARLAAVALSRHRAVGIDAEEWRPTLRRVATRFLSADEMSWITTDEGLLRAWTIREAVYKCASTPGLLFTDIKVSPDFAVAHIPGNQSFALRSIDLTPTLITLAIPSSIPLATTSSIPL